jgi:peptidyl-prolyl cis-trans isomerase SurA
MRKSIINLQSSIFNWQRVFLLIFSFCFFNSVLTKANDTLLVDKLLAIVGDNIILLSDVELQYNQLAAENPSVPENFRCEIFEQMLNQKLFLQQAKVDSIVITEDEIANELDRRIRYFIGMIGSVEKLEEYYEKSIVEIKDEFRKDIADQLLAQKMQSQIFGTIKVTPDDVKKFYAQLPEDSLPYYNAEVELMLIVKHPEISPEQKQLAIEKIEGIHERVMKGEDFSKLAIIYSEDPGSAAKGGDLGYVGRGELVTEFEGAAFRLKPGEVSEVIKTKYGYHIIKMIEQKGERIRASHILIKPKVTTFDLQNAILFLDSIKKLIVNKEITFEKAVDKFSDDEETKNQGGLLMNQQTGNSSFETAQLDKNIYFAIENLNPGEISEVQLFAQPDGEQAARIIMLVSETKPHIANLKDDYYKIKAAALQYKQEDEMVKWTTLKIQNTYIKLTEDYRGCPNVKHWYQKNDSTQ